LCDGLQNDPSDGIIYSLKQGVATLVLCALPSSAAARASIKQKKLRCQPNKAVGCTKDDDFEEADDIGDEMEMSPFKADQVRQAVCKHCFRIPGTSFSIYAVMLVRWNSDRGLKLSS
jgi:hypothetical protein